MSLSYWNRTYAQWVYQYLLSQINNAIGVSALMGNLYAESAICPYRCQNHTYSQSYDLTMNNFRQGSQNNFVYYTTGGGGYSLAQWTWHTRKANYYNFCTQALIGDETKSAEFIIWELNTSDYSSTLNVVTNATDINYATRYVMKNYENPTDQSQRAIAKRQSYAREVYNDFSGLPPLPPMPQMPIFELFNYDEKNKRALPINPNMLF